MKRHRLVTLVLGLLLAGGCEEGALRGGGDGIAAPEWGSADLTPADLSATTDSGALVVDGAAPRDASPALDGAPANDLPATAPDGAIVDVTPAVDAVGPVADAAGPAADAAAPLADAAFADGQPGLGKAVVQLEAGRYHTCARMDDGAVYCWGQGAYGALGTNTGAKLVPTKTLVVDDAVDIQCGRRFSCARRAGGAVYCWGENDHRQLARSTAVPCGDAVIDSVCGPVPEAAGGLASGVLQLALGDQHGCARMTDKTVRCWGNNADGQLGNPTLSDHPSPTPVAGVTNALDLVAGASHTCALQGSPGKVLCWGRNSDGQCGVGSLSDRVTSATAVVNLTDAVALVGAGRHTCARRVGGEVVCWGYNYFGQLGGGSTSPTRATKPVTVSGLSGPLQLVAGRYHSCARLVGGAVQCWGYNNHGELGDGSTSDRYSPVAVKSLTPATSIAAGAWHSCALHAGGGVSCWGDCLGGQLGVGQIIKTATPLPVAVVGLPLP